MRVSRLAYHATDSVLAIGISGPDDDELIDRLRATLGGLAAKHGGPSTPPPPGPRDGVHGEGAR